MVGMLELYDAARADHVAHVLERALEHDGELDVLGPVHNGVADEEVGEFADLALHEGFGVAVLAHGEAVVGVAAHLVHVVAPHVDEAVGDFVVEDDQVALLHLVPVHAELAARDHLEQALLVDLVRQLDSAGALVLDQRFVVDPDVQTRVEVPQDDRVALQQFLAVLEVDHVLVHGGLLICARLEQL